MTFGPMPLDQALGAVAGHTLHQRDAAEPAVAEQE